MESIRLQLIVKYLLYKGHLKVNELDKHESHYKSIKSEFNEQLCASEKPPLLQKQVNVCVTFLS